MLHHHIFIILAFRLCVEAFSPRTWPRPLVLTLAESSRCASTEERSRIAKEIWTTVALQPTSNIHKKEIQLNGESTTVYNQKLWDEFCALKGTYYINGLSSCEVGDRLVHPFEAHGFVKSLVFNGQGKMFYNSNIVNTPLTKKERKLNKIVNRGVMSSVANMDSILGYIRNAISSSSRDTANLTADLWPPPGTANKDGIGPLLITCTDNGEPYALDPDTLETKGKLIDVVPKLKSVFTDKTKFLAHNRYDEARNRLILCAYKMIIPGQSFLGNTQMEFIELDDNFDVVSRRGFTTRFMVFHDWALTENYYVVPKNPAYLKWDNIMKFVFGLNLGTDVFAMEEETNGEFILIPRHDLGKNAKEVKADSFFNCFHFGPVFEKANNELVINGCVFDSYTFGGEMGFEGEQQTFSPIEWGSTGIKSSGAQSPPPRLDQFVVDTKTSKIKSRKRVPVIPVDMPNFNGDAKQCEYSYFLGADRPEGWFPFKQIVKLNCDTFESFVYDAGDNIVSEPMIVPREVTSSSAELNGFVISLVHNAQNNNTKLVVWESQSFDRGPISECVIGDLIPWCVHGNFYPGFNP